MERKLEAYLRDWILAAPQREAAHHPKCFLLQGLRQVGKSYSVRKLLNLSLTDLTEIVSSPHFPNWPATIALELNLSLNASFESFFAGSSSAADILKKIHQDSHFSSYDLSLSSKHRVILFIDEIQVSAEAIKALKFLSFQKYLTVVASGSLLGLHLKGQNLFPTGYVDIHRMFPLDFEEYLWAHGISHEQVQDYVNEIKQGNALIPELHERLLAFYREYVVSGGLPENVMIAVKEGIASPNLFNNQRALYLGYEADIAKYAPKEVRVRAERVFQSIPNALARTRTRFTYSLLGRGSSGSRYEDALSWLIQAGLVYQVNNLDSLNPPLQPHSIPNDFKLYLADPGILWAMIGNNNVDQVLDPHSEFQKGLIYENSTADLLESSFVTDERSVYYFERNSTLEVDFVIEGKAGAVVVEAKSSLNTKSKSLTTLMKENPSLLGVKVSPKNPGRNGNLYCLPHYCLGFLDELVSSPNPERKAEP